MHRYLVFLVSGLLLWRTGHCQGTGTVNGFINFAQPSLIVDEGLSTQTFTTVAIPLVREGGTTGNVFVTITVSYNYAKFSVLARPVIPSCSVIRLIRWHRPNIKCLNYHLLCILVAYFKSWLNLFMLFVQL